MLSLSDEQVEKVNHCVSWVHQVLIAHSDVVGVVNGQLRTTEFQSQFRDTRMFIRPGVGRDV
eukprot:10489349-Lingulodinium_polyedra.AAC.1